MAPTLPTASFILIETGCPLVGLKLGLDGQAHGIDLGQPERRRVRQRVGAVVLERRGAQVAPPNQPAGPARCSQTRWAADWPRRAPCAPAATVSSCQALPGSWATSVRTAIGPGSPTARWVSVGGHPLPTHVRTSVWTACGTPGACTGFPVRTTTPRRPTHHESSTPCRSFRQRWPVDRSTARTSGPDARA